MIINKQPNSQKPKLFLLTRAYSAVRKSNRNKYRNTNTPKPGLEKSDDSSMKNIEKNTRCFFSEDKSVHTQVEMKSVIGAKAAHCDKLLQSHRSSIEKQIVSIFNDSQLPVNNEPVGNVENNDRKSYDQVESPNEITTQTEAVNDGEVQAEESSASTPQTKFRFAKQTGKFNNLLKHSKNFKNIPLESDLLTPFSVSRARINKRATPVPCNRVFAGKKKRCITLSILSPKGTAKSHMSSSKISKKLKKKQVRDKELGTEPIYFQGKWDKKRSSTPSTRKRFKLDIISISHKPCSVIPTPTEEFAHI